MAIGFFTGSGSGVDTSVVTAEAGDVLSGKVIVDANGNPLTGTMPDNGAISQSLGINGSFIIPQGFHNGLGEVSQSISTMGAQTITPGSSAQTVACNGKYMTGNITVNAANVSKVVTGTVTSSSSTKTFTEYDGGTENCYYWSLTLSGFKQVLGVSWVTEYLCGHAVSGTEIYTAVHDLYRSGNVIAVTYKGGGTVSATSIVLPVYCVSSKDKGVAVTYYVYGISS